jgi:valyl-tRNA synthetase
MSKSKGNVVTPLALLQEYGSDGVRYWAARGGPGGDTAFDVGQMKIGRKLAMKLLNVSKFVLAGERANGEVTEPLDRGMLTNLAFMVAERGTGPKTVTDDLINYEYSKALANIEAFFWSFCDNYVEAAKSRRYGDFGVALAASASVAMRTALSVLLRLFAPYLPFVTEEIWSWSNEGSIHRASWPTESEILALNVEDSDAQFAYAHLADALSDVRQAKAESGLTVGTKVSYVKIDNHPNVIASLKLIQRDLQAACRTEKLEFGTTIDPMEFGVRVGDRIEA